MTARLHNNTSSDLEYNLSTHRLIQARGEISISNRRWQPLEKVLNYLVDPAPKFLLGIITAVWGLLQDTSPVGTGFLETGSK